MGVNVQALIARNALRWEHMHIHANKLAEFQTAAKEYCKPENKARFQAVTKKLVELGYQPVPWWFIAVVAEREYGRDQHGNVRWDRQLGQGDPLHHVSTHEPAGRGPFLDHDGDTIDNNAWLRCCLDALINCAPYAAKWTDWSIGGALTIWEEYNGLGYAARGVPSAYVFSGTDQYVSGKYVADHVYRNDVVDVQEGCAPLLLCMMQIDKSILIGEKEKPVTTTPAPVPTSGQLPGFHIDFMKVEHTVETIAGFLPIVANFYPPLKAALPVIPILEGALKLADELQKSGGDPARNAAIFAAHFHEIATQIEALFGLPNMAIPGLDSGKLQQLLNSIPTLQQAAQQVQSQPGTTGG